MPPKKRGRPPKPKPTQPTTVTETKPKQQSKPRNKYTNIHKFEWTKEEIANNRIGYKTETDQFIATLSVLAYDYKIVYYSINVTPKLGYTVKSITYSKWHNTLPSAVTTLIKVMNDVIPTPEIKLQFNQMLLELDEYMKDPTTELIVSDTEQENLIALEDE